MPASNNATLHPVRVWPLYALFFVSGVAALVYQIVWSRWLNEIFGVTVYAVTSVLITFLGGLALGGVTLGRLADRRARPLAFLGALELGVAATALAGRLTITLLEPLHLAAADRFATSSVPLLGIRVLLASAVILPPTFLMGGTLPAMTRVFTRSVAHLGRELSILYAINTAGAVAGTLLAGFVLVRALGLDSTLDVAVALNAGIGLTAIVLGRRAAACPAEADASSERASPSAASPPAASPPAASPPAASPPAASPPAAASPPTASPSAAHAGESPGPGLPVVMALSGFVSLGLEVLWTRALVLPLGTSTYAFVTMLAAFLVGLSLGAFAARAVIPRTDDLRRLLGWLQVGIALGALAALPVLGRLGGGALEHVLESARVGWVGYVAARFGISFLVMLVPTTLIGMTFPVAGALWVRDGAALGRGVGQIYGANTLGNIAGAAVTGFWLIPALGVQRSVPLLVTLNVLGAFWGLVLGRDRSRVRTIAGAAAVTAVAVASVILAVAWRPPSFRVHGEEPHDRSLYYREGIVATVKVVQKGGNARQRLMAVDGVKIGESWGGVDAKQQALAHFPFLIASDLEIRRVLTIGLGTGILAGELARHPVEEVVCVEISPSVIEASRYFGEWNGHVERNPRVAIVNDDGVSYLRRSRRSYDAIVSDAKSRAGHAANALFFSTDYYELCRSHLVPGGLMIQWVPLIVPGEEFRTVLRTFAAVFPAVYVWIGNDSCFLVGRDRMIALDMAHIQSELETGPAVSLARYGWGHAETFAGMLVADRESLEPLFRRERAVNSLDHPYLEFFSLRDLAEAPGPRRAENMLDVVATPWHPFASIRWIDADSAAVRAGVETARRLVRASALVEAGADGFSEGFAALRAIVAEMPAHTMAREEAGRVAFEAALAMQRRGNSDVAIGLYREAAAYRPEHALTFNNLGGALGRAGRIDEAIENVRRAIRLNPGLAGAHENMGVLLLGAGRGDEAAVAFRSALDIDPRAVTPHRYLAELHRAMGDDATADYHTRAARDGER